MGFNNLPNPFSTRIILIAASDLHSKQVFVFVLKMIKVYQVLINPFTVFLDLLNNSKLRF